MLEANKRVQRRVIEKIWSQGEFDLVDELVAGDYVGHSASPPGETRGQEGYRQYFATLRQAFPDLHFTVEDQIAEGDRVATRWTGHGTHQGAFQGIPPTGRQGTITGMTIGRIANGKLVEGWTNADMLGLLQKLGAVPSPEQG